MMISSTDIESLSLEGLKRFVLSKQIDFEDQINESYSDLLDLCLSFVLSNPSRESMIRNELAVAFPNLIELLDLLL